MSREFGATNSRRLISSTPPAETRQRDGHTSGLVEQPRPKADWVRKVVNESCDRSMGAHRPAGRDVQNLHRVEVERIRVLPVGAVTLADVFAVWPDRHPAAIINVGY